MCWKLFFFTLTAISFFGCSVLNFAKSGSNKSTSNKKELKQDSVFYEKSTRFSIKKRWIRQVFPKNYTRPSILQPIKPIMTSSGLLVQGHRNNGVSAYTMDRGKKQWFFPVEGGL